MAKNKLTIIGLGVESGDLSLNGYLEIEKADYVIVRTTKTPSTNFLNDLNVKVISLDHIYEKSRNFDTLNKNLSKEIDEYLKKGNVCYLVDGSVSDDISCKILISKHKNTTIFEGVSKYKSALTKCGILTTAFSSISAYDIENFSSSIFPIAIYDLDNKLLASTWKLKLIEFIGEEQEVWLYVDKQPKRLPIYQLDWEENFDYSTVLIIEKKPLLEKERFNFNDLYEIVKLLRAPNGCPWDRVQTMDSIRKNLIEECYELCDAIDQKDDDKILEEIGDVLLQAVFHIIFAEERFAFSSTDVFTDECKKLIFRHSHIFGKDKATDSNSALDIWDKNKQVEKGFNSPFEYINDVPKSFPALLYSQKVIKRIEKNTNHIPTEEDVRNLIISLAKSEEKDSLENLLLACSYLLKHKNLDGEESLYFATSRLVKACKKDDGKDFDIKKFMQRLVK